MRLVFTIILSVLLLTNTTSFAQLDSNSKSILFIGHPSRITSLDSLIKNASVYALNASDYKYQLKQYTGKSKIDSVSINVLNDSILISVANHFFGDLYFGNKMPTLDFNGANFIMNLNELAQTVKKFVESEKLNELIKYYVIKLYKQQIKLIILLV